ncbi:LysR substrate-binding domain-containing protein [Moraxella nasovis]|uniref:LysR family transcriptional regulator n=1 Tax=Moraxella nasovis TaxID=2904121 RepID=UPI001F605F98|nr:LysR substrate-binding domain-containing protein [Moraxella nasovis]UNU73392.1 LysR substrate-binding domain-containing protein [Moraxella nasovis]
MLDNLRRMMIFVKVVNNGSFGATAKELGTSTSAVSQQITLLESYFGVSLLHRSTRKLSMSEAGEILYETALQIIKIAEQGRDSISQLKGGLSGNLRIATSPEIAKTYLIPALDAWLREYEDLSLTFIFHDDHLDMIEDRIDLALTLEEEPLGKPLTTVKQLLLASPGYIDGHDVIKEPQDLASHAFIAHGDKQKERLEFQKNNNKFSIRIPPRLASNDQSIVLNLAVAGHGIIKTNEIDAKAFIESGELIHVLPDYQLPNLTLGALASNQDKSSIRVERCIELLREFFSEKS